VFFVLCQYRACWRQRQGRGGRNGGCFGDKVDIFMVFSLSRLRGDGSVGADAASGYPRIEVVR